jgi:hypothetical protein
VLDRATSQRDDPGLLDTLPMLGDILTDAPASLQARLFAAVGLELIYNKEDHQVTITPSTPAAIIAGSEPPTAPDELALSPQHPRAWVECPPPHSFPAGSGVSGPGAG